MISLTRDKILICLFLLLLGFAAGVTYERHTRSRSEFQKIPPQAASSQPQFYTLPELKLHEFERSIKILKRAYKEQKDSDPPKLRLTLEEMDQVTKEALEFAKEHSAGYVSRAYIGDRCWYLLASGRTVEAKLFCEEHLQEGGAHGASQLAWVHEEFELYGDAADLLRESISREPNLFYQWERRLRLCRVLVQGGDYDTAETQIGRLHGELTEATQKKQVVGLIMELWTIRAELAKARHDKKAEILARGKAKEYREYWMRLR